MRAVITVTGKDKVGILAKVSSVCSENNVNIVDVTQSVLQDYFAMIMLTEIGASKISLPELSDRMDELGKKMGLSIHIMHEDVFNSMHRI